MTSLKTRAEQLEARVAAVNAERPPKYERTTHAEWQGRRQRTLVALRETRAEYRFLREWVAHEEGSVLPKAVRPSEVLAQAANRVRDLETLYVLVAGLMANDDDASYDALENHFTRISADWEVLEMEGST